MATKDEALKIAIEAIEYTNWSERTAKMETALEACKEALEQPAQEPADTISVEDYQKLREQPKAKKYLYAYQSGGNAVFSITKRKPNQFYLGKIEVLDD